MKKLLLGSASVFALLTGSALAADMPVKAKPLVAVFSSGWAGLYFGANVGYAAANNPTTMTTVSGANFPVLAPGTLLYAGQKDFTLAPQGWNGGLQVGYNWQLTNKWVAGVEADIQAGSMKDSLNCLIVCNARVTTANAPAIVALVPVVFSEISIAHEIKWFGTVRGRLGYSIGPTLFYATGGLAYGEVQRSARVAGTAVTAAGGVVVNRFAGSFNTSSLLFGWTIGAGAETRLTSRLSAKAEYLYVDLGDVTDKFSTTFFAPGAPAAGEAAVRTDHASFRNHIFRLGLNYHLQPTDPAMDAMASAGPLPPAFSWTGLYVGANLGYGLGRDQSVASSTSPAGATFYGGPQAFNIAPKGFISGGQIGANWQPANAKWVLGAEADIQWSGVEDNVNCLPIACGGRVAATNATGLFPVRFSEFSASHKLNWFGTLRARLGYSFGPALFYGTGGLVYGEVERTGRISGATVGAVTGTVFNTFAGSYSATAVKTGWTLGAGAEMQFSNRLTAKAEYLYLDLGSVSDTFNTTFLTGAVGVAGVHTYTTDVREHIFRVGMNYKILPR